MKICRALIVLVALAGVWTLRSRPLTYNLRKNDCEIRGSISLLIKNKIEGLFNVKKVIPYIKYDYTSESSYNDVPANTTVMKYMNLMVYYNIYKRKNNTNTATHILSIKPLERDFSVDVTIKVFQDKISFFAQPREDSLLTSTEYDLINILESAIISIGRENASLDEYQLKRLIKYVK